MRFIRNIKQMLFFCLGFFKVSIVLIFCVTVLTDVCFVFFSFHFFVDDLTGTSFGISQSSRLSSSVSAMRVLNTGSDVEEAVADALVRLSCLCCGACKLLKCLVFVH